MKRIPLALSCLGLLAGTLAAPVLAQTIGGHPSANGRSIMNSGDYLSVGQYLVAANRRTYAIQQDDGNFCIYQGSGPSDSHGGLWCTNKYFGMVKPGYNIMSQSDGNLCVYAGNDPSKNGKAWWCHMQYGPAGPYFTQLRDDGILCTYKGPNPQTIWNQQWCSVTPSAPKQLGQGVVDINQQTVDWINKDPNRSWQRLAQAVGAQGPEGWYIESMKITQLTSTLVDVKIPPTATNWWPAKSKEVYACTPVEASTTVALSQTVSNSITLSKSNTFDASVSATVSYSGLFVSGSVTASAGYSMTNASQQSDQKDATVSDSTTLSFPKGKGGLVVVLWAKKTAATGVPWTASFTPKDDQVIEVTARRLGRDDRVTGRLPWIQMKTYLPQPWTFKVNGTLDMDNVDPSTGQIGIYEMPQAEFDKLCAAGPPGAPPPGTFGGSAQSASASASATAASASAAAPSGRPTTGKSTGRAVEREMSQAELQAKLRNFAPPH